MAADHDSSPSLWQAICDAMTDAIVLLDSDLRVVHVNQTFAGWLGVAPESLSGRYYASLLDGCDAFPHNCPVLRAASSGGRASGAHQVSALGGFYQCWAYPLPDADGKLHLVVCTLRDVTEQRQREAEQARQTEYLAALHETALSLIARRPLDSILHTILNRAATLVGAPHGFVSLVEAEGTEMRIHVGRGAYSRHTGDLVVYGCAVAGRVWEGGRSIVEDLALQSPESMPAALAAGVRRMGPAVYAAGVPLVSEAHIVGVLVLIAPARPGRFQFEELALLGQFAELASIAVDNARLYGQAQAEIAERRLAEQAVLRELAERQRAEKSLRESEAALRSIFRAAPIGIGMVRRRVFEWTNEALEHMVGWSAEQLAGQSARILYPDDDEFERVGREKYAMIEAHGVGSVETRFRHADGRLVHVLLSSAPRDPEAFAAGGESSVVFTALDITERQHAEDALRRSEARYRRFVDQSHAGVWEIDRQGVTVFANERLAGILGYERASELVGRRLYDFFSRSYPSAFPLLAERVPLNGRQGDVQDCVLRDASGTDVYAILSTLPHYGEDGSFAGATLFVTDISARRRMEEALRQSEARYRTLFESAGDAIFIHALSVSTETGSGCFLAANRVACQRLGFSLQELLSRTPADIEPPEYAAQLPARIDELQRYGHHFYETIHIRSDGATIPTELSSRLIEYEGRPAVLAIARDITERKQVEQVLLRTERLAAMGHLAAALAHEINNPLQSVGSSLELALDFPLEEEERLDYLEAVRQEIERLMAITGRVLDFARPMRTERQPVSAADVVHYAFTLAEKQLQHSRIAFHADLPDDLPLVRASRDQLAQVFLNLLLNSMEALPGGGNVHISARAAGDKVLVDFWDSGPGFPPEVLARLFEPFQTTKESGTGLGLAISYSIIQQHGGTITAANDPEGGARLTITLPE
ncbi:MAG TPA: PAS domain S-box protein, partial [Anaerolineae bacterium]|nr:PAS domain S-box protein [Anaerolineae bacterium]